MKLPVTLSNRIFNWLRTSARCLRRSNSIRSTRPRCEVNSQPFIGRFWANVSVEELDQAYALFEAVLRGDGHDDRPALRACCSRRCCKTFALTTTRGDAMKLGRRQFILGGAACATGGLLHRIVQAQTVAGKRLIVVMIRGGWIQWLPWTQRRRVRVSIPRGRLYRWLKHPSMMSANDGAVLNHFQQHGDVTAIIAA